MKQILIVNYGFPPNPGIGGRRWALFAQELSKKGYKIHVLLKKHNGLEKSLYSNILNDKNITLHNLPTFYPNVLNTSPKSLWKKTLYRFWNLVLSTYSKGTQYDKAIFLKRQIQRKALKIIKENKIENVIVSGAPFRLCFYFAEIKNKIPNLIIDFRDPWTWGIGYGYKTLRKKKIDFEKHMESVVLDRSDVIFCPVEIMKSELSSLYPNYKSKIKILPHGFDKNNIQQHNGNRFKKTETTKLIFIGSLYNGIEQQFKEIAKLLSKKNANYTLDIFSNSERYKSVFLINENSISKVNYHEPIPPKELFKEIGNYDFCLIIHPMYGKDNISTKFYELIYSKTPIIYIGEPGDTKSFILNHKLGMCISPDNIYPFLMNTKINPNYNYNPNFDTEAFSFEKITQKLITYFK